MKSYNSSLIWRKKMPSFFNAVFAISQQRMQINFFNMKMPTRRNQAKGWYKFKNLYIRPKKWKNRDGMDHSFAKNKVVYSGLWIPSDWFNIKISISNLKNKRLRKSIKKKVVKRFLRCLSALDNFAHSGLVTQTN